VVDEYDRIIRTEVLKGIGFGCDEEALRVVGLMPNWIPGKQGGRNVRVKYALSINFEMAK
jgi:protein TonB